MTYSTQSVAKLTFITKFEPVENCKLQKLKKGCLSFRNVLETWHYKSNSQVHSRKAYVVLHKKYLC